MTHPLEDIRTFKFFALQHPKPMSLLREIIWQWNRGYAFAEGRLGEWVAMTLDEWSAHMGGVPRRTLQRWLKLLDDNGLIEREPHRFQGIKTLAFLRPTPIALKHMGKAGDVKRLTIPKSAPKKARKKAGDGVSGGVLSGAASGAVGGALDHTTFPSPSSYSNTHPAHADAHTGGEGNAGEKQKKKLILKKAKPGTPIPPPPDDDDVEAIAAAITAKKRARLLKQFPPLHGAHEKFVKHPSAHWGDVWFTRSQKWQAASYAWYVQMVENWQKGKKGKAYKPMSYAEAEFDMPDWNPDEDAAHWDQLAAGKKPVKAKGIAGLLKKP